MKTNKFFQNNKKAAVAFMAVALMSMGFTACSQDDELFDAAANPQAALTRGNNGLAPVSYVERSWDGSKVVSTVKSVNDYIELVGGKGDDIIRLESGKWYVVKSNYDRSFVIAPKGEKANIIICDGATMKSCIAIEMQPA